MTLASKVVPVLQRTARGSRMLHTKHGKPKAASLAVLDDYLSISQKHFDSISPSDLKIDIFKSYLPQQTKAELAELVKVLQPYKAISTMRERTQFPGQLIRELPNLELLLCTGTQFETFDLATAKELGITVVAAPGRGRTDQGQVRRPDIKKGGHHPATQHTWAMLLALVRNVAADDAHVKVGGWQTDMVMGLSGKTLGVVGLGRLGAAVARIGIVAFGMKVSCWSSSLDQAKADKKAVDLGLPVEDEFGEKTFKVVSKEELFKTSDVVSVHYVLSDRSRGIISAPELAAMKKDAFLVNTARGPLVDEAALLETVSAGGIRGVALDVFEQEPLPANSPWRNENWGKNGTSRVLLTPHMGYVEEDIMNVWYGETAENVERWLAGDEVLHRLV